ncbi:MAG: transporter ATP-binding protein, partial [Firmicutes bacterium]|nr:transporter ATP-binding protein [Bacillota bacterium]
NLLEGQVTSVGPDGAVLTVAGMPIRVPAVAGLATGANAGVSLRHERIKVGRNLPSLGNHLSARVQEVIFTGSAVKYVLAVGGGNTTLTAQLAHDGVTPLFANGDEVEAGWEPEAGVVVFA